MFEVTALIIVEHHRTNCEIIENLKTLGEEGIHATQQNYNMGWKGEGKVRKMGDKAKLKDP